MMTHISPPELTICSQIQVLKNPIWWTADILKHVKCNSSAAVRPILMKFGKKVVHINHPNLMGDQKFENLKIQDVGRRSPFKS